MMPVVHSGARRVIGTPLQTRTTLVAVLAAAFLVTVVLNLRRTPPPICGIGSSRGRWCVPAMRTRITYHIEHVTTSCGTACGGWSLFDTEPTSYYGGVTRQPWSRSEDRGRRPPGWWYRADVPLIRETVRHRSSVPASCKGPRWHACYDRSQHQVNLLYDRGVLLNSWLVRAAVLAPPPGRGSSSSSGATSTTTARCTTPRCPYAQFFSGGRALHGSRLMCGPVRGAIPRVRQLLDRDARQLMEPHLQPQSFTCACTGRWS